MLKGYRGIIAARRRRLAHLAKQKAHRKNREQDTQAHAPQEQHDGNDRLRVDQNPEQPVTDQDQPKNQGKDRPASTAAESAIAVFSAVVMVATIVSAGIAYWQWDLGSDQLEFAENSAAAAAIETQDSLNISRALAEKTGQIADSNKIQLEAMQKQVTTSQQQADILSGQLQIERERLEMEKTGELDISPTEIKDYKVGGRPNLLLYFENVGNSQTIEVRAMNRWEYVRPNTPSYFWDMFDQSQINTSMIIPVGRPKPMSVPGNPNNEFVITPERYRQLSSGNMVLRVVAVADYVDGTGRTRRSHFCYSWSGRQDKIVARYCAAPKVQNRGRGRR